MKTDIDINTLKANDDFVRSMCGPKWKALSGVDLEAAWAIAIMKAVAVRIAPTMTALLRFLMVYEEEDEKTLKRVYDRLNCNGAFLRHRLNRDADAIRSGDVFTCGWYGGIGSGIIGNVISR